MIGLAGAILVTSLLGSMHCVGMCGPMALWASGIGQAGQSRGSAWARLTAYHFGRAVTFFSAGLLAGWLGGLVTVGGDWLGWQQTAARLAGSTMIGLGVWRLLHFWRPADPSLSDSAADLSVMSGATSAARIPWDRRLSLAVSARLSRLRPTIARLPVHSRAFAIGIVTTWLPCGWLYLFVLVAAATASPLSALMVMLAFWIGTLPALSALVGGAIGSVGFAPRIRPALPLLIAITLLVTGSYTLSGRAAADLAPLSEAARRWGSTDPRQLLDELSDEPLPCCEPPGEFDRSLPAVGLPSPSTLRAGEPSR